jgi:hypothetical protein
MAARSTWAADLSAVRTGQEGDRGGDVLGDAEPFERGRVGEPLDSTEIRGAAVTPSRTRQNNRPPRRSHRLVNRRRAR